MGVWKRHWNANKLIVFQAVILQRVRHMTRSSAIRRIIDHRLGAWGAGYFRILVEDMARTCVKYLSTGKEEDTAENQDNILHRLVFWGKLFSSV